MLHLVPAEESHKVAEHLWLVRIGSMAFFESRESDGITVVTRDCIGFPSIAHACRAYKRGHVPLVVYP